MKKYCLALDLRDDEAAILAYEKYHAAENVWPEVMAGINAAGITNMEIYRTGNRLFMMMETTDNFDPAVKAAMDAKNEKVQAWETLMSKFQQPLPWAKPAEKWVEMQRIFKLP